MAAQYNPLTPEEQDVILNKGTERPFTGKFDKFKDKGTYICKRCNAPLYRSDDKFESTCGWPSFDDEIAGAVKRVPDTDGRRTEILCANCGAHLGHVFTGEGLTPKNQRHCVNSISMNFILSTQTLPLLIKDNATTETAIFAGGCFWGVEYHMSQAPGVLSAISGYTGGTKENPTYKEVCTGTTGHVEAVQVVFDRTKTSYETVAKLFFEIHDPGQANGQGPDIGEQYHSVIFYTTEDQKKIAQHLIDILKEKKYNVVTKLLPAVKFWPAEDYHQQYYEHKGTTPYCHIYRKKF
ncbi:TPA: methionine sulfoxide reductase [Candidatus Sumerlaeota bacterium]|nr:methionine sulfoxide reductase [Candidatus Sumerlaeota bacterium]